MSIPFSETPDRGTKRSARRRIPRSALDAPAPAGDRSGLSQRHFRPLGGRVHREQRRRKGPIGVGGRMDRRGSWSMRSCQAKPVINYVGDPSVGSMDPAHRAASRCTGPNCGVLRRLRRTADEGRGRGFAQGRTGAGRSAGRSSARRVREAIRGSVRKTRMSHSDAPEGNRLGRHVGLAPRRARPCPS